MCGIAGLVAKNQLAREGFSSFEEASGLLNHRGPDHKGVLRYGNCLLIHYRLSIIDLDERSNQPFESASKRFVGVYNGEIYNYKEIRQKEQVSCRTSSDTEVMIETFERKGGAALSDWNGIFATALIDREKQKLHLIRDRFGVKPLYIYEDDNVLAFASEAKVILSWLSSFSINQLGLAQYLWYGNTTGPQTMIDGLLKVHPGSHITFDIESGNKEREDTYSSLQEIQGVQIAEEEAVALVREKLKAAVKRQLVADVPVGVLLSGGIDSSSIVAFASESYNGQLDTYSIDYDYNIGGKSELEKARLIANKFGTNHHELRVDTNDVKDIFSELVFQYDEPFADTANVPLYQLAKACQKDKKVILQGDGGDEIFAGYRRYNVMGSYGYWRYLSRLYPVVPNRRWRERMKRMSFVLNQPSDGLLMAYYLTQDVPYKNPFQVVSEDWQQQMANEDYFRDYLKASSRYSHFDKVQKLLYTDMDIILPNTYLEKVDKATMRCSIEARVPFLDHELVDFALSLPSEMKVRKNEKKYLLKKALAGIVPDEILYGPKRGFDVPYKEWLKKDLYEFAKTSFGDSKAQLLDRSALLRLLDIHRSNQADYGPLLWKSLVLSHWLDLYSNKIVD